MKTVRESITIDTGKPAEFIDITEEVSKVVARSGIKNGFAILSSRHTTTALCVNEKCERLQMDMMEMFKKIAPPKNNYKHDLDTVDDRANAHSHLMSLLLKTNEMAQIDNGKVSLGNWQRIFFIELDGPRSGRTVQVMIVGE